MFGVLEERQGGHVVGMQGIRAGEVMGGFVGNCRALAFTLSEMGNYWRISSRRMIYLFFFFNVA